MILRNSLNRETIKDFINKIGEDDLINKIIVPFYNTCGYSTLRILEHGPGEHGKDIIFSRNSPALYDNEYLVVQAKVQKITASNVVEMSNQLIRALRTPITGLSGGATFYPNYVIHFNAKTISNDAHWEFPYLVDGKNNIKIITQDNICDLIMNFSIIPRELEGILIIGDKDGSNPINSRIRETLYKNDSRDIEILFNNIIPISKKDIDESAKKMIIDFIFKTWREDKSWVGTVKPMKWLSQCYEFIQLDQVGYLKDVLYEFTSSVPSFDAQQYTQIVFKAITKEQYKAIKKTYMYIIGRNVNKLTLDTELINKFMDYTNDKELDADELYVRERIFRLRELKLKGIKSPKEFEEFEQKENEIIRKTQDMDDSIFA